MGTWQEYVPNLQIDAWYPFNEHICFLSLSVGSDCFANCHEKTKKVGTMGNETDDPSARQRPLRVAVPGTKKGHCRLVREFFPLL